MPQFNNAQELITHFDFGTDYFDAVELTDVKVGFSVKREYPDYIAFRPARKQNGQPDDVAITWVIYSPPRSENGPINLNKVPVRFRVSNVHLHINGRFDYDFSSQDSPTELAVQQRKGSPQPEELVFRNEYFFNHSANRFETDKGTPISGRDIVLE